MGSGNLPSSTESNLRDHVKSILTTVETDTTPICRIGSTRYAMSAQQNSKLFLEPRPATIPFPSRLYDDYYNEEKGSYGLKDLDAYSIRTTLRNDSLPQKEKDLESFTLPYYINNVCFKKNLADLGASVSVMPFSTYTNLGLGELAHTKLTLELADRTVKHPKGMGDIIVVKPFCKEAYIKANQFDGMITICKSNDNVTYQMARSHLRFKHLTNAECTKYKAITEGE
ncbi:hypothetical protein Tco_0294674 [Tanacetum coccineum]